MYGIPNISYRALGAYGIAQPVAPGRAIRQIAGEPHTANGRLKQLLEGNKGEERGYRPFQEPVERVDISKAARILLDRIRS